MAKRICLLNGENDVQDYDVLQWQSAQLQDGVLTAGALEVQPQVVPTNTVKIAPGVCLIEVTRTVDSKTFKMNAELTAEITLTIQETDTHPTWKGAVVATIAKANVDDGTENPEDGTGIFNIQYIPGLSTTVLTNEEIQTAIGTDYYWNRLSNVKQDPTVASGDIEDTRLVVGIKQVLLENEESLRAYNSSGIVQQVLKLLTSGDYPEFQIIPRNRSDRTISSAYQLIDRQYFEDNIPETGPVTFELYENLTAGDLVKIINDGGVAKIKKLIKDSDVAEVSLDATSSSVSDCVAVSNNKVVVVWDTGTTTESICLTISGTTLTVGSKVQVKAANSGKPTIAKLDTDKFVVCYEDRTAGTRNVKVGTVSGTTITLGTQVQYFATSQGGGKVLQMGTDKFVITYTHADILYGRVATVVGTVPTFGTEYNLDGSITNFDYENGAFRISDDIFFVLGQTGAYYCTISGTVITANSRSVSASAQVSCWLLDSTHFLVFESNTSLKLYSFDASSITLLQTITFAALVDSPQKVLSLGTGKFLLITSGGFRKGWLQQKRILLSPLYSWAGGAASMTSACLYGSTANQFFFLDAQADATIAQYNDFEELCGILQTTGTAGQSHPISLLGDRSNNHAFDPADVGKDLYWQSDETLATDMTGFFVGRVISEEVVSVKAPYEVDPI